MEEAKELEESKISEQDSLESKSISSKLSESRSLVLKKRSKDHDESDEFPSAEIKLFPTSHLKVPESHNDKSSELSSQSSK